MSFLSAKSSRMRRSGASQLRSSRSKKLSARDYPGAPPPAASRMHTGSITHSGVERVSVIPEMHQLLLEQMGLGKSAIEAEEFLELLPLCPVETAPRAQEQPPLAAQEGARRAALAKKLGAPRLIERLADMAQHVELVVDDVGAWQVGAQTLRERFPHIHAHGAHRGAARAAALRRKTDPTSRASGPDRPRAVRHSPDR